MSSNPHNATPLTASPTPRIAYRADGKDVDYIPDADTPAGSVVPFGNRVGITKLDVAADALGAVHLGCQADFPKVAATAFAWGDEVAWDDSATAADGETGAMVAASGTVHGIVSQAEGADAGTAIVRVLLL